MGEELQPEVVTEGLVWIVDPLDGTTNFLHDFPSYAVSIAGAVDGVLEAAAIVNVPMGETYTASRGGGAWHGDRRLTVSAIRDPGFALIGTGFPFKEHQSDRGVSPAVRPRRGVKPAASGALAPPRSTWLMSPRVGSTGSGSSDSPPGTSRQARCSFARLAGW